MRIPEKGHRYGRKEGKIFLRTPTSYFRLRAFRHNKKEGLENYAFLVSDKAAGLEMFPRKPSLLSSIYGALTVDKNDSTPNNHSHRGLETENEGKAFSGSRKR